MASIVTKASAEAIDLLNSLLVWDPRLRPNADVCLQHPFFHKRNLSNCNPRGLEPGVPTGIYHSLSSASLTPNFKPQVVVKSEGLKKIGANLILNYKRNKF